VIAAALDADVRGRLLSASWRAAAITGGP